MSLSLLRFLGVTVGLVIALVVASVLFSGQKTRFEDMAIMEGSSYFASANGVPIHCTGVADAAGCIDGARRQGAASVVLWLGNSQLHAINQYKPGEVNAPPLLHEKLRDHGDYLLTFSEPNANLQEHLLLYAFLQPRLKAKALVLPVVFDDMREAGIRTDLLPALDDPAVIPALSRFPIGERLLHQKRAGSDAGDDLAGIHATLQEKSERALNRWLADHWKAWADRSEARGQIFVLLYNARNTLLGIRPTSVRKMIPGRFADNWAALEAILALAAKEGVEVYLYVPPLRNDVSIPYSAGEYDAFKKKLVAEFGGRPGVSLANLEGVVPNRFWGTKAATSLGAEPEYDFMHFQAEGHRFFADAMFAFMSGAGKSGQ